jgi:hypothetical protein
MKRLLVLGAFVTASLFFFGSHAGTVQAQPGNYGDAGCGLGSILFGAKPGFVQVFAATTNGTFGSQTYGITTGTSNCAAGGGGTPTARNYVETNREAVAKDISRGSGGTIADLSQLAGCKNPNQVGRSLQKNFKRIFPRAGLKDTEVSANVVGVLRSDASLQCTAAI